MADYLSTDPAWGKAGKTTATPAAPGLLTPGNIDLHHRPVVKNPDGSISTVRSIGVNIDGREVLLPTVSDDGRILSNDQAISQFKKTGQHLGIFDTPEHSTAYAQSLHEDQANEYGDKSSGSSLWQRLNTPLLPQIDAAAKEIADHIDTRKLDQSVLGSQIRGFLGGAAEGAGHVLSGFTSPIGLALSLAGLGEASPIVKSVPGLKSLMALPAVKSLQRAVQATGGAAFAAEGAGRVATDPTLAGKAQGVAEMASGAAGVVGSASRGGTMRVAPENPNPAQRAAVEFGLRAGIPVDAATATGNPVMRGTQWLAERTAGGSVVGGRARQRQAEGFARVGGEMADRVSPTPVSAEQAGQGVRDAVAARGNAMAKEADTGYGKLRAFEDRQAQTIAQAGGVQAPSTSSRPFTNVPLAVDTVPTKTAMRPIYDALLRKKELVGSLMGDEARALTALDGLINAPDTAPLSVADAALSDLKALSRVDQSFKRTVGQGVMAQAVTNLDKAVVGAAKQAGPDVIKALMDGRAATVNKFKAIDVFDALGKGDVEPVRVFQKLTTDRDGSVNLLRKVQREAPAEIPKLGRAYLEGLLTKAADGEGGVNRAAGVFRDWENLGPQTKAMLFADPAVRADLDHFFLLMKKTAENPNPAGTAFTLSVGGQGAFLISNPVMGVGIQVGGAGLSALLHSRPVVHAMVRGLSMPAGSRHAQTAAWAMVANAATKAGAVVQVPAAARSEEGQMQSGTTGR